MSWSRGEALRTRAFWLIVTTFGVAHVGVTGLNLHVFSYVSDQGHPAMVAALVMSIIAVMQFSTPMVWGLLAERANVARLIMAKFLIQAVGILLALSDPGVVSLYAGFFLYGIGMGGTAILAEMIWANYFGRISLGPNPRHGLLDHQRIFRRRPAVFRSVVRRHPKLFPLLQHLHRHAVRLGVPEPFPTTAEQSNPHFCFGSLTCARIAILFIFHVSEPRTHEARDQVPTLNHMRNLTARSGERASIAIFGT